MVKSLRRLLIGEIDMPRQSKPNANNALGNLLQEMLTRSKDPYENSRPISWHPGLHPGLPDCGPRLGPVVVKAEYMSADGVEAGARGRLSVEIAQSTRSVWTSRRGLRDMTPRMQTDK